MGKEGFSSRAPLLEVIGELGDFTLGELLASYRKDPVPPEDTDEVIGDYLDQLVKIRLLRKSGDRFTYRSSEGDEE